MQIAAMALLPLLFGCFLLAVEHGRLVSFAVVQAQETGHTSLYEIDPSDLAINEIDGGDPIDWSKFKGNNVLLISNLASECGFTEKGYNELNALHERYHDKGLEIIGFPCNQFGKQEPGSPLEIFEFAKKNKGAKWRITEKVDVNGEHAHPLFRFLKGEHVPSNGCEDKADGCYIWAKSGECEKNPKYMHDYCRAACGLCTPAYPFGGEIMWNFEYFLIGKGGQVLQRYRTGKDLLSKQVIDDIEAALNFTSEESDKSEL